MSNRPKLVGITGGIGSGKSTICRIFSCLGVPTYDADSRARWLMNNDSVLIEKLKSEFGTECYKDGFLDRDFLGKLVFANPEKLAKLNAITHPAVAIDFENWVFKHQKYKYLVKEAALLIESGMYKQLDTLILVTAPEQVRIDRVLIRDPFRTSDDIRLMIQRQMPEKEKQAYSNIVIDNDGIKPVLYAVLDLHQQFLSKS